VQEAIHSAEFGTNIAISHTDQDTTYPTTCEPGTGDGDTIVLKPGEVYSFDKFWDGDSHNYMGPTATPIIFKDIIIQGNGATLQWVSGANPQTFRLFAVGKVPSSGPLALSVNGTTYSGIGSLTLQNVYVKNFHVKGGDGRDGGGGGLGAGGAIYVDDGASLTVDNSTFENNGAVGGNGSSGLEGGGGGLFGNGGAGGAGGNGGGGGGGARGDGGKETSLSDGSNGGGGGGTVFSGTDGRSTPDDGGSGGYLCGGGGGGYGDDGQIGGCPGGGGGGGGGHDSSTIFGFGNGGNGAYGGGVAAPSTMVALAVTAAEEDHPEVMATAGMEALVGEEDPVISDSLAALGRAEGGSGRAMPTKPMAVEATRSAELFSAPLALL